MRIDEILQKYKIVAGVIALLREFHSSNLKHLNQGRKNDEKLNVSLW